MNKYNFNVSTVAYQKRSTAYIYDRCFFYSSYKFRINQRKRNFVTVPHFTYPSVRAMFAANHLSRDTICMSSSNPGLLFYALVFEAIGFFGCQVHLYLKPVGDNVSEFFVKFTKGIADFSRFNNLVTCPALLRALRPLLDPVYTIQASLFLIKRHKSGFAITGEKAEAFYFLRWFDVVQSLYGLDDLRVSFSFVHDSLLLFLCQQFFDFEKKHSRVKNPTNAIMAALLGIQPQYFSYQKVVTGLSFQIVYDTGELRVCALL